MAKQFSPQEREIIQYICDNWSDNSFVLTNVFNQWFNRTGVSFDPETGGVVYDVNNISEADVYRILNEERGIIEIALLIKYLVDRGYIYLIKKDKEDFPKKPRGNNAIISILNSLPTDIADIIRQTFRRVYVSYDLIKIVDNNFKTDVDLQLETAVKANKASLCMLILTFVSLVFTIGISISDHISSKCQTAKVLDAIGTFQMNSAAVFNKNALDLSAHIDSLGISFTQKDNTVNVNNKIKATKRPAKRQYNLIQIDTINCDGKQYIVLPIKK